MRVTRCPEKHYLWAIAGERPREALSPPEKMVSSRDATSAMPTLKSPGAPEVAPQADPLPRAVAWTALVVVIAAALAVIGAYVPSALVLPTASVLLAGTGFALAAATWLARLGTGRGPTFAWDLAGALVFLGIAAALITDDKEALALLGQLEARSLASIGR